MSFGRFPIFSCRRVPIGLLGSSPITGPIGQRTNGLTDLGHHEPHSVECQPQDKRTQNQGQQNLIPPELHRDYSSSLSRPKAVCSTLTASSAYFSSITHEILISDVLIIEMLIFSLASVVNIIEATPE